MLSCSPFYRSVRWTDGRWRKDCQISFYCLFLQWIDQETQSVKWRALGKSTMAAHASPLCCYWCVTTVSHNLQWFVAKILTHPSNKQSIHQNSCSMIFVLPTFRRLFILIKPGEAEILFDHSVPPLGQACSHSLTERHLFGTVCQQVLNRQRPWTFSNQSISSTFPIRRTP